MSTMCCKLTIFEGCDGSGKTTAAKRYAKATGARYVHFGPLLGVHSGLARMYVEAMLPALLGYQDVVFDRSWLSEKPYGIAFRRGQDRIGPMYQRFLERLAMRCGAVVVKCDPGYESIYESWSSHRKDEMLETDQQLKAVYDLYADLKTHLPVVNYSYMDQDFNSTVANSGLGFPLHFVETRSAGNALAPLVLVGDSYSFHHNEDSYYQWPFSSFSLHNSTDLMLASILERLGIPERKLLWVDSNQDLEMLYDLSPYNIFALSDTAAKELYKAKILATYIVDPKLHLRTADGSEYPLFHFLERLKNEL